MMNRPDSSAVRLIEAGAPLPYLSRQMGHSSITVTVDTYGRWLPNGDRTWVDRLDALTVVPERVASCLTVAPVAPRLSPTRVSNTAKTGSSAAGPAFFGQFSPIVVPDTSVTHI
jgi:hypothetical protein